MLSLVKVKNIIMCFLCGFYKEYVDGICRIFLCYFNVDGV